LSATATRNLPMSSAGAGAGIYNTTRQVGAVLGSAAIAALLQARLTANLPGFDAAGPETQQSGTHTLPSAVAGPFSDAMAQSILLPAAALLVGVVVVLFFSKPSHDGHGGAAPGAHAGDHATVAPTTVHGEHLP